jgi:hypothetical protein
MFRRNKTMTVDHGDDHNLAPANSGEPQTLANYYEKFNQLLTKYVTYAAPRQFALCQDPFREDAEGWVFAWGAAFDDRAVVFSPDGKLTGTFNSADSALDLFSRTHDLYLVWTDPTIFDQSDAIMT